MHENHPRWDGVNRIGRYLERNRANIVKAALKTVVTGVLSGGVAVGFAFVALATKTAVIYTYRRYRSGVATAALGTFRATSGFTASVTPDQAQATIDGHGNVGRTSGKTIQQFSRDFIHSAPTGKSFWNSMRGKPQPPVSILQEAEFLIEHGALTQVMNAFAELDNDARALHRVATLRVSGNYKTCDQAWQLMEYVERVNARIDALADAIELIQDVVEYSVLCTTMYDSEFTATQSRIKTWIVAQTRNRKTRNALLNDAANSRGVFNSHFRQGNHVAWARTAIGLSANPHAISEEESMFEDAGERARDAALEYGQNLALSAARVAGDGADFADAVYTGSAEGAVKSISAGVADGSATGAGIAIDIVIDGIENVLRKRAYKKVAGKAAAGNAASAPPLIEILDSYTAEDCKAVRTAAKQIIAKFVTKLRHFDEADRALAGLVETAGPQVLAEKVLRRQKLRAQVAALSEAFYLFHELTVGRAIAIQMAARKISAQQYPAISAWMTAAAHPAPCDGLCCYRSSADLLPRTLELMGTTFDDFAKAPFGAPRVRLEQIWGDVPFMPVPAAVAGQRSLFYEVWKPHLNQ
jgi:hypothetical protein